MNAQQYQMMQVLQKIPVFKGLEVKEALLLLRLCHSAVYKTSQIVFGVGEPSTEMLILLKGRLHVASRSGEVLASLQPGAATGEMGIFTGHPRSASIVAAEPSAGLIIRKPELAIVLSSNKDMHLRLLYNIISLLSDRLADANKQNDQYAHKLEAMVASSETVSAFQVPQGEEESMPGGNDDDLEGLDYDPEAQH